MAASNGRRSATSGSAAITAASVRAPNVSETGFPVVPNFAPGFHRSLQLRPDRLGERRSAPANCAADLGALLTVPGLPNVTTSLPILSGSNPNLEAETSDSWTVGAVIQPRFLPGLSMTVDYYDITVNDVITLAQRRRRSSTAATISRTSTTSSAASSRVSADPALGPLGEQPGAILGNSLDSAPFNFAKRYPARHRLRGRLSAPTSARTRA